MIQYGGPLEDVTYFFVLLRHNILLMLPLRDSCVFEYHMVILQFEVAGIQILFLFLCHVPVHQNQVIIHDSLGFCASCGVRTPGSGLAGFFVSGTGILDSNR